MIGKRVGGELYVHRKGLTALGKEDQKIVTEISKQLTRSEKNSWNVVRIGNENIAFLSYRDFDGDPFPTLDHSTRIDLFDGRKSKTNFKKHTNPPILHRKELLVPENYPNRQIFECLTSSLDQLGIFYDVHTIGHKTQWENRLATHGIKVTDHKVCEVDARGKPEIERHKTALIRYQLSQPTQLLMRFGLINNNLSFFDYGCGRGDDVDTLRSNGFSANGWDPYYAADNKILSADIVNIGFVLNVIENPSERKEALAQAWKLTKKVLAVAVMTPSSAAIENAKPYKDGFLTSRNTFQKYFSQKELQKFISSVTQTDPIAVSPGIFFLFADEILQQNFLITRFERSTYQNTKMSGPREKSEVAMPAAKMDRAQYLLKNLEEEIISLGRPLHIRELSSDLSSSLKAERISFQTAQQYCLKHIEKNPDLKKIARERRDDLTLYFASELFNGHQAYRKLPIRLQQDLKTFWGSYSNAQIEARKLLFSAGEKEKILLAAEEAANEGLGYMLPENQFQFHTSSLKLFPLSIRCYIACGSVLYGDIEQAELIKVHINTAKISLQYFENFDDALPILKRRIKIDMRTQKVRIFDYSENERKYLYMKSLYLPETHEFFDLQNDFDKQVAKIKKFDFSLYGPDANVFDLELENKNLCVSGYQLKQKTIN